MFLWKFFVLFFKSEFHEKIDEFILTACTIFEAFKSSLLASVSQKSDNSRTHLAIVEKDFCL